MIKVKTYSAKEVEKMIKVSSSEFISALRRLSFDGSIRAYKIGYPGSPAQYTKDQAFKIKESIKRARKKNEKKKQKEHNNRGMKL